MNKNIINDDDSSNQKKSPKDELTDKFENKKETPQKNNSSTTPGAEDLLKELEDILQDVFKPREDDIKFITTEEKESSKDEKPETEKPEKESSKDEKSETEKPEKESSKDEKSETEKQEKESSKDEKPKEKKIKKEKKPKEKKLKEKKTKEEKKPKKKKTKIFPIFIFALIFVLSKMCVYGWDMIDEFLDYYEQSIPEVVLDDVVLRLNQGEYVDLLGYASFDVNEFENVDDVAKNIMLDQPANYEYVKDMSGKNNYYLIRDSIKIGEVSLKTTDLTNEFELPSYEINNIIFNLNLTNEIQLTVPHNSTITINGIEADEDDYSLESNQIFSISEKFTAYEDIITIDGFMVEPDIKVYYNDVELTSETDEYILELDENKYNYISTLALEIAKKYANFTSNDLALENIEMYFDKTTETYNKVKTYNGIYYNSHSSFAFEDILISDVYMLNDNIIQANVSFNYVIISWNGRFDYPTSYTIYFDSSNNKVISLAMN